MDMNSMYRGWTRGREAFEYAIHIMRGLHCWHLTSKGNAKASIRGMATRSAPTPGWMVSIFPIISV